MRRKRLQHAADILCQMFCGWRLINSYRELERLGSGRWRINALTEQCLHNGIAVKSLTIAGELAAWLKEELAANNIDIAAVHEATLEADVILGSVPRNDRRNKDVHYAPDGRATLPAQFITCDISCRSRVATDEKVYTSEYSDHEEWPPGWP